MKRSACFPFLLLLLWPGRLPAEEAPKEIVPREGLVIEPVGRAGRTPIHIDAIESLIVAGKWAEPKAGDKVTLPDGATRAWQAAKVGEDGWLAHAALRGGYAYFPIPSDAERVMVLEASGHLLAYVNGEPRGGDPYSYGYVRLPVLLKKGTNDLLLLGARGRVRAKLVAPQAAAQLDTGDTTLPDLIADTEMGIHAALPVLNTTTEPLDGLIIEARVPDVKPFPTALPPLLPLSTRKVGFDLGVPRGLSAGECEVAVVLLKKGQEKPLDTVTIKLRVRKPEQSRKVTFVSDIDLHFARFPPT